MKYNNPDSEEILCFINAIGPHIRNISDAEIEAFAYENNHDPFLLKCLVRMKGAKTWDDE